MFRRKRRSLEDFRAEIESHLTHEADDIADEIREGHPASDSEGAARRAFGNNLVRDLRLGARQIRRRPAFSLFVIITLAMGIGANSAIFSVVEAVLLRPLPYRDPGRLVMLFSGDPARVARRPRPSAQFQGLEGAQSQF